MDGVTGTDGIMGMDVITEMDGIMGRKEDTERGKTTTAENVARGRYFIETRVSPRSWWTFWLILLPVSVTVQVLNKLK